MYRITFIVQVDVPCSIADGTEQARQDRERLADSLKATIKRELVNTARAQTGGYYNESDIEVMRIT